MLGQLRATILLLQMDIKKIMAIHELIKRHQTGPPKALSARIGVSERTVYHYIRFMKTELNTPVKWSATKQSYVYETYGDLNFDWQH